MFHWLTKTKKGYTLVELMIVLVLLSLGAVALMNLTKVAYRAFNKSEERYIKQEEVKNVAEILRSGTANVAASKTADIFTNNNIIPTTKPDKSFSYLYIEPHKKLGPDGNPTSEIDGYFLYCLNKGTLKSNIEGKPLSETPMYVTIDAIQKEIPPISGSGDAPTKENSCGVIISLAALENDFDYSQGTPTQDDIYYSLDVAYHFPNMATDPHGTVVSRENGVPTKAVVYGTDGNPVAGGDTVAVDKNGTILRLYCDAIISGDTTESNAGAPSLCFIATASYGHGSGEVGMLCDFRDKCLLTNPLGTAFVKAYYAISPPIADFIAENETLKAAVRVMLKPLIIGAEYALNPELRAEGAICLIAGLACLSGATITLIAVDKRRRKEKRKASK